jgi:hypothetical protein
LLIAAATKVADDCRIFNSAALDEAIDNPIATYINPANVGHERFFAGHAGDNERQRAAPGAAS